jgi:hypothetical protein
VVAWTFHPTIFWIGGAITLLALALLGAALLQVWRRPDSTAEVDTA